MPRPAVFLCLVHGCVQRYGRVVLRLLLGSAVSLGGTPTQHDLLSTVGVVAGSSKLPKEAAMAAQLTILSKDIRVPWCS